MRSPSQRKRVSQNSERDRLFNLTSTHAQKPNTHVRNVICTSIRLFFLSRLRCDPKRPPDTMLKANIVRIFFSTPNLVDRISQHCIRGGANARSRKNTTHESANYISHVGEGSGRAFKDRGLTAMSGLVRSAWSVPSPRLVCA